MIKTHVVWIPKISEEILEQVLNYNLEKLQSQDGVTHVDFRIQTIETKTYIIFTYYKGEDRWPFRYHST